MQRCGRIASIYLSQSRCIYENLAFEEWLFRNHSLESNGEAMLLWSNTPAVVIGRHQNPWIEADLKYCEKNAIKVARRHSGGGAVYHDLGNLNVSFLTSQKRHNRVRNLNFLSKCLNQGLGISNVVPNQRDDLVLQPSGCKISGTAARISKDRAYHHLTILVKIDLNVLKASLHSSLKDKIESNATMSTPAKSVGFLTQKAAWTRVGDVQAMLIKAFESQFDRCQCVEWTPSEEDKGKYVGLHEMLGLLKSEEWIYEKTPRFELSIFAASIDDFLRIAVENAATDFYVNRSISNNLQGEMLNDLKQVVEAIKCKITSKDTYFFSKGIDKLSERCHA